MVAGLRDFFVFVCLGICSFGLLSNLKYTPMTEEQANEAIKAMNRMTKKALKSKKASRQLLIEVGAIDGKKGERPFMEKYVKRAFAASARSLRFP